MKYLIFLLFFIGITLILITYLKENITFKTPYSSEKKKENKDSETWVDNFNEYNVSNLIKDKAILVFPHPDSPTIPNTSPGLILKEIPFIALTDPFVTLYFNLRLSTTIV